MAGIGGPVMGYVTDATTRTLRPLNGMPGSALLGDPVDAGMPVDRAAVDGARGQAIAADLESGRLALVRGLGAEVSVVAVEGALARPDLIAISPSGSWAALYSREGGQVQAIRLEAELRVAPPVGVDAEAVAAIAVDDLGTVLAAARGGIHAVAAGEAAERIVAAQEPTALALRGGGFVYADRGSNEVVAVSSRGRGGALTIVAQERDGVAGPVGLAVAGRSLVIGNERNLLVWDLESGYATGSLEVPAAPAALRLLGTAGGRGTIALNEAGESPLWLIDPAESEQAEREGSAPRLWFVPAATRTAPEAAN